MANFGMPQFRKLIEITDDVKEHCRTIEDASEDYEAAAELPADERSEAREQARDEARGALAAILAEAEKLRPFLEALEA